jgi:hypothetical protein
MNIKKPVGIIILGALFVLNSLFGYIYIFKTLKSGNPSQFQVYMLIWSGIFFVVGIGVIKLKKWSRILALILVGIKTIQMLIGSIRDTLTLLKISAEPIVITVAIITTILIVAIAGWIIHYLTRPNIIERFKS